MSASRTLLAALVAVCLGAYIYWVERPKIREEADADRLLVFEVDDVAALTLRYSDSPDIALERRPDGWYMTEPLKTRGDDGPIRLLLERIRDTEIERRIPISKAENLATYGLQDDGERARISLVRMDGTALPDIIVGATTPVDYQAFARVQHRDEVLVTALIFHTGIGKTPYDLRSKDVFDVEAARIDALSVVRGSSRVALEHDGAAWNIIEPVRATADASAVRTLTESIGEITALAFINDDGSSNTDFGFDESSITIEWRAGGTRGGFVLGGPAGGSPPGFYLRRQEDGTVIKAPEWIQPRFDVDLDVLRDKRLFSCTAEEIVEADFTRSDETELSLRRAPGQDWTISGVEGPIRQRAVERAIEQLAELAGKQVLGVDELDPQGIAANFGLDVPDVTVTLRAAERTTCGTALARSAPGEIGYYVSRAGSGIVMSIPPYLYSRMDLRSGDLIDDDASP